MKNPNDSAIMHLIEHHMSVENAALVMQLLVDAKKQCIELRDRDRALGVAAQHERRLLLAAQLVG